MKDSLTGMKSGARWVLAVALLVCAFTLPACANAAEEVPAPPKVYLNGKVQTPTVQELSGITTRPLRLLVQKNNKARADQFIQPCALGTHDGDELRIEMPLASPGVRVTLYKIMREPHDSRYLSMPISRYYDESRLAVHTEKIVPFREEYFMVVYEKTNSSHEKDVHVRYFQERVRKLVITSLRTNLMLSSLKFKMKDFGEGDGEREGSFERNAQELVDKLINPQRVFLFRLWKYDSKNDDAAPAMDLGLEKRKE